MSTRVTFLGHATFEIEHDGTTLLIDPFLNDNPVASKSAGDVSPDVILITHGHFDHVADAAEIAKRCGAKLIANFEIAQWFEKQGIETTDPQHIGGTVQHEFGSVKLTIAHHGSGLPDGSYGGSPAGLLLKLGEKTIYHAGDTALFLDMQLIGEEGVDLAILPIGDRFTMGPEDALKAVEFLTPEKVIPCHYNTWPPIAQDGAAWAARVSAETSAEGVALEPGESLEL